MENDPTLVATINYLLSLDSFLETKQWELIDYTMRVEEAKTRNRALEVQLERACAALAEAEHHTDEVVKALQESIEQHLSEVNKVCKAC